MRPTLLTTILASSALLISAAEIDRDTVLEIEPGVPINVGKPECVYNAIAESNIDCDIGAILECFEEETNREILDRIQQCLKSSGCISKESADVSYIWADTCRTQAEVEVEQEEQYFELELKRRDDSSTAETTSETTTTSSEATAVSTTSDTTTTSSSDSSTTASAAASTTVASSTTSDSSSTGVSTTLTATTSAATTATSASTNSCYDYSTTLTTACWVTGGSRTCATETATVSSCADGMLCATDSGVDVCMVKHNKLTTSGIAVAIVFGSAIATFFITLITCTCRGSRAASRKRKAYDAAMEAGAKVPLVTVDMEAGKGMPRSLSGIKNKSRSPLSNVPLQSRYLADGGEDTSNLLGNSRQASPNPMSRSVTGESRNYSPEGSRPPSPSRSEENHYHEARR